jgi:hypothetical protein
MLPGAKFPLRILPSFDVFDKKRVEICGGEIIYGLHYDPSRPSIGTTHLQHMLPALQHFSHELIAGECKKEVLGIIMPSLIGHQAQGG